jgi:hypothetical protein
MERLEKIYKALSDRWSLTVKFGGDWNDGYSEGVKHAMGLVYEEKRKLERSTLPSLDRQAVQNYKKNQYNYEKKGK